MNPARKRSGLQQKHHLSDQFWPQTLQQIDNIQLQVNQKKSELLEQKNQMLQNLQQVQLLELDQEVNQFQMESFFRIELGDNLISKMQVEVVLRDGIVEEIRGDI